MQTTYFTTDTRIQAAAWAEQYIPLNKTILTEPYDLGILPFQNSFSNITSFPLYELDQDPQLTKQLSQILTTTDIILLPSQRLYRSRLLHPTVFPRGYAFYNALRTGKLGFDNIYQTSCNVFCSIETLNNPIFSYEETATVFDHPFVFIFKKTTQLSSDDYLKILQP